MSISSFAERPQDYLLSYQVNKSGQGELSVIKKGLWTWIKIHVGSRLGLFDRKTLDLQVIASHVSTNQKIYSEKFIKALDLKTWKWNIRHLGGDKIKQIAKQNIEFDLTEGNFSNWTNEQKEFKISALVIALLPGDSFTSVKTSNDNVSHEKEIELKGQAVFPRKAEMPNFERMVHYLNEGQVGQDELSKLASCIPGAKVTIFFAKNEFNKIHVKIVPEGYI